MDVHNYDPTTGEYLGTYPARLDPRDAKPLVPAHATLVSVPAAQTGRARVWNGEEWEQVADLRGTVYWRPDGTEGRISAIGVELPADAVTEPPAPPFETVRTAAVAEAVNLAAVYRERVFATRPERAMGWMLKALFAAVEQMENAASDANPARAALAQIGRNGFETEADITGEQPNAIRDAAVASAAALFTALQLIEGMERLASRLLPQAEDQDQLDATVAQLRALEETAATQLAQITGGSNV